MTMLSPSTGFFEDSPNYLPRYEIAENSSINKDLLMNRVRSPNAWKVAERQLNNIIIRFHVDRRQASPENMDKHYVDLQISQVHKGGMRPFEMKRLLDDGPNFKDALWIEFHALLRRFRTFEFCLNGCRSGRMDEGSLCLECPVDVFLKQSRTI